MTIERAIANAKEILFSLFAHHIKSQVNIERAIVINGEKIFFLTFSSARM